MHGYMKSRSVPTFILKYYSTFTFVLVLSISLRFAFEMLNIFIIIQHFSVLHASERWEPPAAVEHRLGHAASSTQTENQRPLHGLHAVAAGPTSARHGPETCRITQITHRQRPNRYVVNSLYKSYKHFTIWSYLL